MATCKDCLHYGICVFHLTGDENQKCPHYIADVVPKSQYDLAVAEREANVKGFTEEIERMNVEIQALRAAANSYKMHYESAKAEVAREIFEEIEFDIHQLMFERDETRAIAIEGLIAELKKKYVPDTDDGNKVSYGDICVVCGEHVPEGRQICSMCEVGQKYSKKKE